MDLKNMTSDEKYDTADNLNTSVGILRDLAKDEYDNVRWRVAKNPSTPEDILRDLAKDKGWEVRESVAENPKASSNLLIMQFEYEKSLGVPDEYVIRALYAHKNLPHIAKVIIETLFGEML